MLSCMLPVSKANLSVFIYRICFIVPIRPTAVCSVEWGKSSLKSSVEKCKKKLILDADRILFVICFSYFVMVKNREMS